MRILLTGASGLVGSWLLRAVPDGIQVVAAVHTGEVAWPHVVRGDLRDSGRARQIVSDVAPDLMIHAAYRMDAAGIVASTDNVARAAHDMGAALLLLSTDAVFAGDGHPRAEDAVPDPVWDYGRWKVEAERIACLHGAAVAVARLPLLVSLDPPDGMVRRITAAAATGTEVGWYAGERRQPAYASEVAAALWRLVALPVGMRHGVWHLPGIERLERRDLGARIAAALGVVDPGVEVAAPPADQRPRDLVLTGDRARAAIGWRASAVLAGPRVAGTSGS